MLYADRLDFDLNKFQLLASILWRFIGDILHAGFMNIDRPFTHGECAHGDYGQGEAPCRASCRLKLLPAEDDMQTLAAFCTWLHDFDDDLGVTDMTVADAKLRRQRLSRRPIIRQNIERSVHRSTCSLMTSDYIAYS